MKTLGIYCFIPDMSFKWDENNYNIGRIGSSEIWAIKLSEEFAKCGYDVYVFGNPTNEHDILVGKNTVKYKSIQSFKDTCSEIQFDHIILSRTTEPLKDIKNCDSIFLMCHDINVIGNIKVDTLDRVKKNILQIRFSSKHN